MFTTGIDITIVIGIIIIISIPAALGWVLWLKDRSDIKHYVPWVIVALKAARKGLPVMMLHHPSSNTAEMIMCKRDKKGSVLVDDDTIGLHFSPEVSGRCKPTKLNGLDVYFGDFITPNCLSHEDVILINKIHDVRDKFPKLRTLNNQTLLSLFSQPKRDWLTNSQSILTALRSAKLPAVIEDLSREEMLPITPEELVAELTKAYNYYIKLEPRADYILTTYESIKRRRVEPARGIGLSGGNSGGYGGNAAGAGGSFFNRSSRRAVLKRQRAEQKARAKATAEMLAGTNPSLTEPQNVDSGEVGVTQETASHAPRPKQKRSLLDVLFGRNKRALGMEGVNNILDGATNDTYETNPFIPDRITPQYQYLNAQRIPAGLRQFSIADAIASQNAALTSNQLELYGAQVEIKTMRRMRKSTSEKLKENMPTAVTIAIIIIAAGVFMYMFLSGMGST